MRTGAIWFLILAFSGAWIPWEIAIRMGVAATSPTFQIFGAIGAFSPAWACFVVRRWITREGFGDAGLRLDLRRWHYYLAKVSDNFAFAIAVNLVAAALVSLGVFVLAKADLASPHELVSG